MTQERLARINELARKAKTPEGLTEAEQAEREVLRKEYLEDFRANFRQQLEGVYLVDEKGNRVKHKKKK